MKTICFSIWAVLLIGTNARAGEIAELHRELTKDQPVDREKSRKDFTDAGHGVSEIGLERTPCFGTCPVYTVVLKSDGSVRYTGERFVERQGKHRGKLRPHHFHNLARFIKDAGYMDFEHTYTRPITDHPTVYTTVVINGKRKVVENYANAGPSQLWAVEQLIDKMLSETEWDDKR